MVRNLIILCGLTLTNYFGIDFTIVILLSFFAYFMLYKLNNRYRRSNINNKTKIFLNVFLFVINLFGYTVYANLNLVKTLAYFIVILIISIIIYYFSVYEYELK